MKNQIHNQNKKRVPTTWQEIDEFYSHYLYKQLHNNSNAWSNILTPIFYILAVVNHGLIVLPTFLIYYYFMYTSTSITKEWRQTVELFAVCLAIDIMIVGLLKQIIRRKRPHYESKTIKIDYINIASDRYSFPSGHVSRAIILSIYFMVYMYHFGNVFVNGFAVFAIFTGLVAMGASRVALGKHYISDVMVGYLCGFISIPVAKFLLQFTLQK